MRILNGRHVLLWKEPNEKKRKKRNENEKESEKRSARKNARRNARNSEKKLTAAGGKGATSTIIAAVPGREKDLNPKVDTTAREATAEVMIGSYLQISYCLISLFSMYLSCNVHLHLY